MVEGVRKIEPLIYEKLGVLIRRAYWKLMVAQLLQPWSYGSSWRGFILICGFRVVDVVASFCVLREGKPLKSSESHAENTNYDD
jgi:hypothetical protein